MRYLPENPSRHSHDLIYGDQFQVEAYWWGSVSTLADRASEQFPVAMGLGLGSELRAYLVLGDHPGGHHTDEGFKFRA